MMGKIMKGTSFGGCVSYVLKKEKSQLLDMEGVRGTPEQMAELFELQTLLNDKVKNTVGHISLSFSPDDGERIRNDNVYMTEIAREYMKQMGIENTQFIIARHFDREHPHCHIVYNRVDYDGKTISDKNDRYRNEKVCKMLTAKYRLHFADGKDLVKVERLRPYDRAKYEVYQALKEEVGKATNWQDLKDALTDRNIDMRYKVSRTTQEIQGVKFEYGKYSFSGSKVDRQFSYSSIDYQLKINAYEENRIHRKSVTPRPRTEPQQEPILTPHHSGNDCDISLGLLNMNSFSSEAANIEAEQEMNEILRRKKAKRKRGLRL